MAYYASGATISDTFYNIKTYTTETPVISYFKGRISTNYTIYGYNISGYCYYSWLYNETYGYNESKILNTNELINKFIPYTRRKRPRLFRNFITINFIAVNFIGINSTQ